MNKKINKSDVQYIVELSKNQLGILYHYLKDVDSSLYNSQISVEVNGPFNEEVLRQSVARVQQHNDVLRSVVRWKETKKPIQIILKACPIDYQFLDLSQENDDDNMLFEKRRADSLDERFDLLDLPLRMLVVKKSSRSFVITITHHHILYDGWSSSIFVKELIYCYTRLIQNEEAFLLKKDYKTSFQKIAAEKPADEAMAYWRECLSGYDQLATVPHIAPAAVVNTSYRLKQEVLVCSGEKTSRLNEIGKKLGVTLNSVMQAAWGILISKYNHSQDVVFGSVASVRSPEIKGMESIMGLLINTIPVRVRYHEEDSIGELIKKLQANALDSESHKTCSLSDIHECSSLGSGLFDHIYAFENYPVDELLIAADNQDSIRIRHVDFVESSNYDFNVIIVPGEEIKVHISYNSNRYGRSSVVQVLSHFDNVLSGFIASGAGGRVSDVSVLSPEEEAQLLHALNRSGVSFPTDKTVIDLFEDQVKRNPENPAVQFGDESLTYAQLDGRSNRLARYLVVNGVGGSEVGVNQIVGLLVEKNLDTVVAMLAILKAGGAYLPIDPTYPKERIRYIIEDSKIGVLLTQRAFAQALAFELQTLCLEDAANLPSHRLEPRPVKPTDLCYVIYTSGTTGKPKGVMIEHRNVVRLFFNQAFQFDFNSSDVWTMFHSHCFDFSVWEMYGALLFGGKVIIIPREVAKDTRAYLQLLKQQGVTVLNQTPSAFYTLIEQSLQARTEGLKVRYVIFGGESLSPAKLSAWVEHYPKANLINMYGITETTIHVTYKEIGEEEIDNNHNNIGRPIPTLSVYVMDGNGKLVPKGVAGELYVGGAGVARGYINNEELTNKKFVANPYQPGERLYRSGDLVRVLADGDLEYLGRMDHQVKIRGYRIELGEIELQLLAHPQVREGVVLARQAGTDKYLVAYYVADEAIAASELSAFLARHLPDYMVPAHFVPLAAMPLTVNGKIDRKALPDPEFGAAADYVAPVGELEGQLAGLWSEVLSMPGDAISVTKSFFELGGHSLKAMTVMNRLNRMLGVEIPMKTVFERPSIREMGSFIQGLDKRQHVGIKRVPEKEYYAVSSEQERLYFLHELDKEAVTYNTPFVVRMQGVLDREGLTHAFRQLIARHESLRTSFALAGGVPVQQIREEVAFDLWEAAATEEQVPVAIEAFIRPFDLSQAPLLRVGLLRVSAQEHLLLVDMHHIINDGVSVGLLIKDFMALYQGETLPPLSLQYKDYAEWQQSPAHQESLAGHRAFWLEAFAQPVNPLELPTDYARPAVKTYAGTRLAFGLGPQETSGLRALAEKEGATLFMVLLSAFKVLLRKLGNQEDLVVGTPVAGRGHADLEDIIGVFVNSVAIRSQAQGELSFSQYVQQVKAKALACFAHQSYQFEALVEQLGLARDTSRNPLFDVVFVLQNFQAEELRLPGLRLTPVERTHRVSKFDLTLTAVESGEEILLDFEYCSALFKPQTVERFIAYLRRVVAAVIADPGQQLSQIELLSDQEKHQLLVDFNDTAVAYPRDKTIVDLFEQQAASTPRAIALVGPAQQLSYQELSDRSNRLASLLTEQGVRAGDCVGIYLERYLEAIVAMLGTLKAGAAYLPLEVDYPIERIEYMLQDSKASVVLTRPALGAALADSFLIIDVTTLGDDQTGQSLATADESVAAGLSPERLAYVMYTSGTTGTPKGVLVSHRNVVRLVSKPTYVPLDTSTRILLTGSLSFDATTFEIWGALLNGGTLHLVDKPVLLDTALLGAALQAYAINTLWLTSPLFNHHVDNGLDIFAPLHYLLVGGDKLSPPHVNRVRSRLPELHLINGYGPTENTTFSVCCHLQAPSYQVIPIGKPIGNSTAYILDQDGQVQPIGAIGELYVGGDGVAGGYLNNEALTNEKFVRNPHKAQERIYRTGDMARWLADGTIEFVGRRDEQVKLRGYRLELGEITSRLLAREQVREAVVVVRESGNDKQLVAYYCSEAALGQADLREALRGLPEYMQPAHLVHLPSMPLTPNGKIDRKALPDPELEAGADYVAPVTDTQRKLVEIWSQVLGVDPQSISMTSNFFELGGHSLKAVELVSKIAKGLQVELSLEKVFEAEHLQQLADSIVQQEKSAYTSIPAASVKDHYVTSAAQKRLYFLHAFDPGSLAYNIPYALRLKGELDKERLAGAFRALIARHESLRTYFGVENDEPVQRILPQVRFTLPCVESAPDKVAGLLEEHIRPFDLSEAPLMRVVLINLSPAEHLLLVDMHHIISDGVSMGQLTKDFMALYEGQQLAPLPLQYKDFSEWQQDEQRQAHLHQQKQFWLKEFEDRNDMLELPLDYPRPPVKSNAGKSVKFTLNPQATGALKALAEKEEATLFMVLLSVFYTLLSRLTNQQDIVVGTPVAGRQHADLNNVIGMFVNTLALRNFPKGESRFSDFLREVKHKTLQCFDHQSFQFEDLVDALGLERDTSHNPLFDVMFAYQNFEKQTLAIPGLALEPCEIDYGFSKFDLTMTGFESDGALAFTTEYATDLFEQETIERFNAYFTRLVDSVIADPGSKLSELSMLSGAEQQQLLEGFNNTTVRYNKDTTLVDLFEAQVQQTPGKCAVFSATHSLTYGQLNEESNRLAHWLSDEIPAGGIVAILMNRSTDFVVSVLAVLKAGATYLPIDAGYPGERINYLLDNSQAQLLLTTTQMLGDKVLTGNTYRTVLLDKAEGQDTTYPVSNPGRTTAGSTTREAAYIIYTSGSTGKPKGVKGSETGLLNRLYWGWANYPFDRQEVACLKTNIGFVDHVVEMFSPLLAGVPLRVFSDEEVVDIEKMIRLLNENRISRITLVPTYLKALMEVRRETRLTLDSLKYVFCSGEELPYYLAKEFYKEFSNILLVNIYGSTEVGADATCHNVERYQVEDVLKYFKHSWLLQNSLFSDRLPQQAAQQYAITAPNVRIEDLAKNFLNSKISNYPTSTEEYYSGLQRNVLPYSINTASPTFIGHMTSVLPDYVHDISKLVSELNQNLVKIETSKSLTFLEREAIAILHRVFYSFPADFYQAHIQNLKSHLGIITTGGSTANMSAILTARNKLLYDGDPAAKESIYKVMQQKGYNDFVLIGSRLMHYSFRKAISLLGLGTNNILYVENDKAGRIRLDELQNTIDECRADNALVLAIIGIGGSTETGSIDPLPEMAQIAKRNNIHFHVDAAWGGALVFSDQYRKLIKGIEEADSITFCGHKQLFLPQGISICLFRDPNQVNYNSTEANYQARADSFDLGRVTLEGSRSGLSLCLHASLKILGKKGYELLIDKSIDLADSFVRIIKATQGLELISKNINIVNYRYVPLRYRKPGQLTSADKAALNEVNSKIQEAQFLKGNTFVSKTKLRDEDKDLIVVFRVVLLNPLVTHQDLENVIKDQFAIIKELFGEDNRFESAGDKKINLQNQIETEAGEKEIRRIPAGKPIANTKVLILNDNNQIQPIGVVGEICVSGDGLTLGYVDNSSSPEAVLTGNPYFKGTAMYKTGDLGRWLPDGNIEFMGRRDNQVKIRGQRIELGEVENRLLEHDKIRQAAVVVRKVEQDKQLVGYYESDAELDATGLRMHLALQLPDYMIPGYFIRLQKLPLTPSGKIDRKALPEPELGAAAEYVAPASELEEQLAALWSQVLALPKEAISATRSFFELGGHSLKAIGLVNKLGKALHVELPLKKVFEYQSIRELGRYLEGLERQTYCPINPAPEQPYYRVSSAQKRMYFLYAFDPSSTAYNMSHVLRLEGVLDRQRLTHAFYQLICRHESLRTSFELAAGVPVQKIAGESDFQVSYAAATQEQLPAAIEAFIRPFDLSQAPLLRVGLLRVSAQEHVLLVDMHHIISDGVSLGLLIKDFMALYRGEALPPLSLQYKDYAEWQQSPAHQERLAGHGAYWLEAFAQPVSLLELPTDFLRPAVPAYGGRVVDFKLGAGQTSRLKALLHAQGSTLFMGLLAIYNILLSKLSNQEDIVVGSSSAGRSHPDLEPLMGMFVNTLALRNYPQGQLSFKQFLQQVTTSTLSCFDHQSYQYEDLIDALALERNTSRNPLFDVAFDLNNQEEVTFELPGLRLRPYERELKAAQFDLSLRAYERQEELWLSFEYATALFKGETIARFIGYFHNIVAAVIEHADAPLSSIEMLPGPERQQLLIDFNDSQVSYGPENFIDLLGRAARQYPTQIALCDSSHQLTYEQLERVTNRIANYLRGQSLPEGQIIPLLVERGLPLICLMVGIQKAGYVFVALDVHQPADRLQSMLLDCGGALVITDQAHQPLSSLISTGQRVVVLEAGGPLALFGACAGTPTHTRLGPDQITYLIYTSGSTGLPKGVLLHQQGMVNHFRGLVDLLGLDASDCIAQTADCSFDIFVVQALLGLVVGARTVIVSREDMLDADRFSALISQQGVTVIELVPTVVKHLLDTGFELAHHRLRWLISCGEKLTGGLVSRWYKSYPQTRIVNAYGPAEASDDVSACVVPPHLVEADHGFLPIGKPLPNVKLYIMNHYQQLCPLGTRGEICISGVAVGKGYWRNPEQTRSKFVSNPYVKQAGEGHTILYRTGDVGYWQADGNLVFVGRKDSMVKIRGARVELGEIEASLLSLGQVEQVVVLEKEGRLVAYYVANPPAEPAELREQLSRKLPDYMVPSHLVPLPSMPLTANGKIDRKALPEPHQESVAYCPPRTKAEHLLSRVFSQVLGRERVGIDDNFFAIGGDSIKSIQICSRLRGEGYRLTIQDIFTSQVIRQLALRLREEHVVAPQGPVVGQGQLTPIQQLHFQGPIRAKHHYNQALTLCFAGGISRETVGRIFDKILLHHDALRMVFREQEGVMMQHNQAPGQGVWLEEKDLRQAPAPQQELLGLANDLQASLDLAGGPLLKLGLYHLAEGSRLLVVIHHLVVDGVSWRILLEDVQTLYGQVVNQETLVLPLKTDAFVDWSGHLEKYKQGVAYQRERSYWQSALRGQSDAIPYDYQAGSGKLAGVRQESFRLSKAETAKLLTAIHQPFRTQINDVLLAAFWLAVSKHYGLQRLRIDMEGHGREELGGGVDVSRTVGWFTSIYPVWLTGPGAATGADLSLTIRTIKEQLRQIPNKGLDYLLYHFETAHPPAAAQVFFEYLGQFDEDVAGKRFQVSSEACGEIVSPDEPAEYDWYVSAMVVEGQLKVSLSYCDRFKASSLVALLDLYRQRLQAIIACCETYPTSTLSPSDLSYKDLSIEELDHLQGQYAIEDIYPLSPMQEGMLFHSLVDEDSPQYFEQVSYHLAGDLDLGLVEASMNQLVARHPVLRTVFLPAAYARPLQVVLKERSVDFRYHDVREQLRTRSRQEVIAHYEQADKADTFDLSRDRLVRLTVLQVERQGYVFIWSHHHVLMDGWCMGIIINEYSYLYASLRQGKAVQLPPVRPYADYINWLATRDGQTSAAYWRSYLAGYESLAGLPRQAAGASQGYCRQVAQLLIGAQQTSQLRKLGVEQAVTLNTVLECAWGLLLSRYNDREDVVFGSVVSGRPSEMEGVEDMVGLFINTVPVRMQIQPADTLSSLLTRVQGQALASEPHHYSPLYQVQSLSELGRGLLDHVLVFENYPVGERIAGAGQQASDEPLSSVSQVNVFQQTSYDLSLEVYSTEVIRFNFVYNENAFEAATINSLMGHFENIVRQFGSAQADAALSDIGMLSVVEQQQLLFGFNDTQVEYPHDQTIIDLFEQQARSRPHQPALLCGGESMSYRQFQDRVDTLAAHLLERGLRAGDVVGVLYERSFELLVSLYAVMKAGGVYLPLEGDYPAERLAFLLSDSGAGLLLAPAGVASRLGTSLPVVDLSALNWDQPPVALPSSARPEGLAYIIYTSGSTGRPKGVMIQHNALVNRIHWMQRRYPIGAADVILQKTPKSFDVSLWELVWWSLTGSSLCLLSPGAEKDPQQLTHAISSYGVSVLHFVPPMLQVYLDYLQASHGTNQVKTLRWVFSSGEALPAHQVNRFNGLLRAAHATKLVNLYGPTEATIDVSYFDCYHQQDYRQVPIGKPIDNTWLYVLDAQRRLQPVGVAGELYIGGLAVGRGYVNNQALSRERFVADPYRPGERLYRTGDLARVQADGNIEYLGRLDHQVKIRGYRIELGEIEHRLAGHDQVKEAVVLVRESQASKYLVAYYVAEEAIADSALSAFLAQQLPDYMVPAHYVPLAAMPLTANGKLDRKALPDPEYGAGDDYVAPAGELEEQLAGLWSEVLGLPKEAISVTKSFFELGGHSLSSTILANKITRLFGITIPLKTLFEYPTIVTLAQFISAFVENDLPVPANEQEFIF